MEQRFGRYRVVAEIGRGGMGVVYEAYDEQLHRSVALKTLLRGFAIRPDLIARFLAEARLAAQLDDPNIVPVYDVGIDRERPFIAMKLVRGASLQELLASGPLPLHETLGILREVASALDYAHRRGVVHRDVKPGNILIADNGRALVTDFGIASVRGGTISRSDLGVADLFAGGASLLADPPKTIPRGTLRDATGSPKSRRRPERESDRSDVVQDALLSGGRRDEPPTLAGTPEYVAPECVLGREATAASDIYALGVVAYHVLVGRPPFQGPAESVLRAQVRDQPCLTGVAGPLRPALQRALAKDYAARFVSAGEFARALQLAARHVVDRRQEAASAPTVPSLAVPFPKGWRRVLERRAARAALTSLVLFAALFSWYAIARPGAPASASSGTSATIARLLPFLAPVSTPIVVAQVVPSQTATSTATSTPWPTATATPSPTATPTPAPPVVLQERLAVGPNQTEQISIRLMPGDRVKGSFFVAGGTILGIGSDIVFRIAGPDGTMLNVGRVEREHQFQFTAEALGEHRLIFQNTSALTGRQIYVTASYPSRQW